MKQWNMALQCRAQSSQVKVLHSTGLAATGRDSFATSITEAALEEVLAQVAKDDGAPSAVEAAASEAAPMGNLAQ